MIPEISKNKTRKRIHERIRNRMDGSSERPRLNVYRSLNHIYAQLVDDMQGKTLVAASTNEGKKKGEKKRRAGAATAGEFATKNFCRCSSLQTSGVILGTSGQSCQRGGGLV